MSGFLLDTNCVSEVTRLRPDPRVMEWLDSAVEQTLFLSVLTLGEIRRGLAALPEGTRRARLESWLEVDVRNRFSGRVLPIDEAVADRWGVLSAQMIRKGKAVGAVEGLLAATALHYNLTVVSRNAADFRHTDVEVLNPWLE